MKHVKYRLEDFALFDYRGVEKHLEKMAAKGWQLSKIVRGIWIYQREEPTQLRYSVTYLPKVSVYDPVDNESAVQMEAYCESAGWKKVTDWAQMQIYCTDNQEILPLETDESVRFDVIRRSMRRSFLLANVFTILMYAVLGYGLYKSYVYDPIVSLAQNTSFYLLLILLAGICSSIYSIGYLGIWLVRSKKSVRSGGKCLPVRYFRITMRILLAIFVFLVVAVLCSNEQGFSLLLLVRVIFTLTLLMLVGILHEHLRHKGVEREKNFIIITSIAFVFALIETVGFQCLMDRYNEDKYQPDDIYYEKDIWWNIYYDEIPLRIENLIATEHKVYSTQTEIKESFFLTYQECEQSPIPYGADAPYLWYEVVQVKYDGMYDWCVEQYLDKYIRNAKWLDDNLPGSWHEVTNSFRRLEETDWPDVSAKELYEDVDRIYRSYHVEDPVMEWLICKDDFIICLQTDIELTSTQMRDFSQGIVSYYEDKNNSVETVKNDSLVEDYMEQAEGKVDYVNGSQGADTKLDGIKLSDGTRVVCRGNMDTYGLTYYLENGTELLDIWDKTFFGLKNGTKEEQVSLDRRCRYWDLDKVKGITETAQNNICTYLENLKIPYNEADILESAYADYVHKEKYFFAKFEPHLIGRSVELMADTEEFVYFLHYMSYGNAVIEQEAFVGFQEPLYFSKTTGEKMKTTDFFAISEEKLAAYFIDCWLESEMNSEERKKVEDAFSLDYLILKNFGLENMGIEICFPEGTLTPYEQVRYYPYEMFRDILQPWVLPKMVEDSN